MTWWMILGGVYALITLGMARTFMGELYYCNDKHGRPHGDPEWVEPFGFAFWLGLFGALMWPLVCATMLWLKIPQSAWPFQMSTERAARKRMQEKKIKEIEQDVGLHE